MNIIKKCIAFTLLLCPLVVFGATNDNEIILDQAGDTLKLYIDQIGYGNKVCGTIINGVLEFSFRKKGGHINKK